MQRVVVQIISSKVLLLFMHAMLAWFGKRFMLQMPIFQLQHTKGLFFSWWKNNLGQSASVLVSVMKKDL